MPNFTPPVVSTKKSAYEFTLVLIMLAVLTILVFFILYNNNPKMGIQPTGQNFEDYLKEKESILSYRKDLLAIIIAAFGAWIGAGAAYFFGRENLRESANGLLQLHRQITGAEKLANIKVKDIPPKLLNANYDEGVTLKDAMQKLTANPAMWFISVKTGDKWYIVNNEALFIYIKSKLDEVSHDAANVQKTYKEINDIVVNMTLKDAIPGMLQSAEVAKFINQFIFVKMDDNASYVNQEMDARGVFLAILTDDNGNFAQYFTTSDIRKALVNT